MVLTCQFAYFMEQALGGALVWLSQLPPGRVQWPWWYVPLPRWITSSTARGKGASWVPCGGPIAEQPNLSTAFLGVWVGKDSKTKCLEPEILPLYYILFVAHGFESSQCFISKYRSFGMSLADGARVLGSYVCYNHCVAESYHSYRAFLISYLWPRHSGETYNSPFLYLKS